MFWSSYIIKYFDFIIDFKYSIYFNLILNEMICAYVNGYSPIKFKTLLKEGLI